MYRGVTAGRPPLEDTLIVDIGGGSTELVLGSNGGPRASTSLDIGCVRVTERYPPLGSAERRRARGGGGLRALPAAAVRGDATRSASPAR